LEAKIFANLRELFSAARESSNHGNDPDDQLSSKARRKLSSSAVVTGPHRKNKVGEIKKIIRDRNLCRTL